MIKLPAALDAHKDLCRITDSSVQKGQKNMYFCPDPFCGEVLKVRKDGAYIDHFSHLSKSNCSGLETSLHLLCKEVLIKQTTIKLPALNFPRNMVYDYFPEEIAKMEKELKFYLSPHFYQNPALNGIFNDQLVLTPPLWIDLKDYYFEVEKPRPGFKPDLSIIHKDNPNKILHIEIAVTHFVEDKKLRLIKEQNLSFIEYDFSEVYKNKKYLSENDIVRLINNSLGNWVHSSRFDRLALKKKKFILDKFKSNIKMLRAYYLNHFSPFFTEHILSIEGGAGYKELKKFWQSNKNTPWDRIFKSEMLTIELLNKFLDSPNFEIGIRKMEGVKSFLSSLRMEFREGTLKSTHRGSGKNVRDRD